MHMGAYKTRLFVIATALAIFFSGSSAAEELDFRATFVVDGKTTFDPADTVIITDPDFGNVVTGDIFVVDFTLDTDQFDTDDAITVIDNAVVDSSVRHGNFGSLLTAAAISAAPGNAGGFDPAGIGFSTSNASETSDGLALFKSNNALANSEYVRVLAATSPTPPSLGGSLTDLIMNFRNIGTQGLEHPDDYLDDRSVTVDPFTFDALFTGPSAVQGNARDLVLLTDDILGTGFDVNNLNRPLSLAFGQAEVIPAVGEQYQQEIYAWGTFNSLIMTNASGNATFAVTKTFEDGFNGEVDVQITCNGGLPLEQSATIQSGANNGVTFTVTDFADGTSCTITETAGPDGYTPVYNGGTGCTFDAITNTNYSCAITNEAAPGSYTVNMVWELVGPDVTPIGNAEVHIVCDQDNGGVWEEPGIWVITAFMDDGDSATVSVDTSNGEAECWAVPQPLPVSGVETFNGCSPTFISAAEEESCEITNTYFFEGIPMLDRYGLALLVVLSLGLGLFGIRRLV